MYNEASGGILPSKREGLIREGKCVPPPYFEPTTPSCLAFSVNAFGTTVRKGLVQNSSSCINIFLAYFKIYFLLVRALLGFFFLRIFHCSLSFFDFLLIVLLCLVLSILFLFLVFLLVLLSVVYVCLYELLL